MFHTLRALSAVGGVDLVCGREQPAAVVDLEPLKPTWPPSLPRPR